MTNNVAISLNSLMQKLAKTQESVNSSLNEKITNAKTQKNGKTTTPKEVTELELLEIQSQISSYKTQVELVSAAFKNVADMAQNIVNKL